MFSATMTEEVANDSRTFYLFGKIFPPPPRRLISSYLSFKRLKQPIGASFIGNKDQKLF